MPAAHSTVPHREWGQEMFLAVLEAKLSTKGQPGGHTVILAGRVPALVITYVHMESSECFTLEGLIFPKSDFNWAGSSFS